MSRTLEELDAEVTRLASVSAAHSLEIHTVHKIEHAQLYAEVVTGFSAVRKDIAALDTKIDANHEELKGEIGGLKAMVELLLRNAGIEVPE